MSALLLATSHLDHDGFWFFPLLPLLVLTFWLIVFVSFRRRWHHSGRRSGEAVLAERYARGEIDEAEYRERRSVLRIRN